MKIRSKPIRMYERTEIKVLELRLLRERLKYTNHFDLIELYDYKQRRLNEDILYKKEK